MQIQIITTKADGTAQRVIQPLPQGKPLVVQALPNSKMFLSIDGVKQTGNEWIQGKKPTLKRAGKNLLLEVEGEALIEITDFYADATVSLDGSGWSFTATDALAGGAAASTPPEAVALNTESSVGGFSLGGVVAGGLGLGWLAAKSSAQTKTADTIINGVITAGPVVSTHQLKVEILDATGKVIGSRDLEYDGSYSVNIGTYTGPITARVAPDNHASPDFRNEADGKLKDLNATLLGIAEVKSGSNTVNINPATTIAALDAGLDKDGKGTKPLTSAQVAASNAKVAAALGLLSESLTETTPKTTVDSEGNNTSASANNYGKILAAFSGMDNVNGGDMAATILRVKAGLDTTGKISSETVADLIAGAQNAGVQAGAIAAILASDPMAAAEALGPVIDNTELAALTPAVAANLTDVQVSSIEQVDLIGVNSLKAIDVSVLAQALTADKVAQLTPEQLAALTPAHIKALAKVSKLSALSGESIAALGRDIAALTTEQINELSAEQCKALTVDQIAALNAADKLPPREFGLAAIEPASVAENAAYSAAAPTLTGKPIGAVTYSLSGTDAALFAVNASTGAVSMIARNFEAPADAGADNVYNYSVVATDADGNTASRAVAVTVTDVIEVSALTLTAPATASVAENAAYSAAAPSLTGTPIGAVTYTLTGADAGLFTVNASTGVVSMIARNFEAPADADADNVYDYTLVATDADGNTASQAVVVTLTNVNEAPTAIALSAATIAENVIVDTGVEVGTLTVTDPDASGNNNVLSLSGPDAASFVIAGGKLMFTGTSPNFEVKPSYSVTVTSTDGTLTKDQAFTVNVTNVNEAPTAIALSAATIAENVIVDTGVEVGTLTVTDPDASGNNNVLSLSGPDAASFVIAGGKLMFTGTSPNFEVKPSYSVTVTSTDGTLTKDQAFTVNVTNVNEAPAAIGTISDQTATKGQSTWSLNTSTYFSDADSNDTATYSLSAGTLPGGLTLSTTTGVISGTPTGSAASSSYTVTRTDSGGLTATQTFNLNVVDLPALASVQSLDNEAALDVRSALVLAFNQDIALGNGQIKIFDDANAAGWVHRNTTTNETVQDTFNNDVVITLAQGVISQVTIGGTDYTSRFDLSKSLTVNGNNLIIDLTQKLSSGPGASVGNTNTTATTSSLERTAFDWDFGSNYHVEFDAGIVKSAANSALTNAALTDSTTLNFTTVTPSSNLVAAASKIMDATGASAAMSDGMRWISGNQGEWTLAPTVIDMSVGAVAVVIDSNGSNTRSGGLSGNVQLNNFSINDLLYMDNHGDLSMITTNGLSFQNAANWTNGEQRSLTNNGNAAGSTYLTMYSDAGLSLVKTSTGDSGMEVANKFGTHFATDVIIFG